MKILKVVAENYTSFEKLSLDDTLLINIIFGYNNSGKSNILRLLELLFKSRYEIEKVPTINSRGQSIVQTRKIMRSFWDGLITDVPYIFRIKSDGTSFSEINFEVMIELTEEDLKKLGDLYTNIKSLIIKAQKILIVKLKGRLTQSGLYNAEIKLDEVFFNDILAFNQPEGDVPKYFVGQDPELLTIGHYASTLNLLNDAVLFLDTDRFFSEETDVETNEMVTHENFKSFTFNLFLNEERHQQYLDLLKFLNAFKLSSGDGVFMASEKNSPFNTSEFKFEFVRNKEKFDLMLSNGSRRLPLSSFGTGIQQLIYQLTRIFLSESKIILIEEFELNLSPKYQLCILEYFDKLIHDKVIDQLFFTTHSPVLSYRTENRTIQARINEHGISTAENITPNAKEIIKLKEAQHFLSHFHPSRII